MRKKILKVCQGFVASCDKNPGIPATIIVALIVSLTIWQMIVCADCVGVGDESLVDLFR